MLAPHRLGRATLRAVLLAALAFAVAAAVVRMAPPAPGAAPYLLAVSLPQVVAAGAPVPVYGGVAPVDGRHHLVLQVCDGGGGACTEVADQAVAGGQAYWGWLGAIRVPTGTHEVRLLVRARRGWLGVRTVGQRSWRVTAR